MVAIITHTSPQARSHPMDFFLVKRLFLFDLCNLAAFTSWGEACEGGMGEHICVRHAGRGRSLRCWILFCSSKEVCFQGCLYLICSDDGWARREAEKRVQERLAK